MNKGIKKIRMNGKDAEHTRSIVRSQILDLIIKKKIMTTLHKAKVLSSVFDRLVTHAKSGENSGLNKIKSFFGSNKRSIDRFMQIVKQYMGDRNSGYLRVIKTSNRVGDNSKMAYVMFSSIKDFSKERKSRISKVLEKANKSK
ncbi:50S ribosomal protein L17 [Candidatus Dojkabacteria bacterium]|uniref:50S ribosomal protein L17 n=1 Tax=Candidatus Dojkabacteria bacterium TaxID=2099670 RepID=A0A3M0Z3N5_9BACT|nr:MAG: 50S ribosomal protein L17 [Candidatus Dojkabacteria bacterium]